MHSERYLGISVCLLGVVAAAFAQERTASPRESGQSRLVAGPSGPVNAALSAGSNATVTFQPVLPTTLPPSSYPPGTTIEGTTIRLSSVPARVWIHGYITGWAPEALRTLQARLDATGVDGEGGGFLGENAGCGSAADLFPAIISCTTHADCRAPAAGLSGSCPFGEPVRCNARPAYFPPGGNVCDWVFLDSCRPDYFASGIDHFAAADISTINARFGWAVVDPGGAIDHAPSYVGTVMLDVPADARGTYVLDLSEAETFMQNYGEPPDNFIPIAQVNLAVIEVATCMTAMDCNDSNSCTVDTCGGEGCCDFSPVAGWNQATECCNPETGMQSPIPADTSCRIGGCSLGGSLGSPTQTHLPDGTACNSGDPCQESGQCQSGLCVAQQYAGSDCPKSRFISFEPEPGPAEFAYRVRLVSLHHPVPPYTGGMASDFSAFEGQYRWAGVPTAYSESSGNPAPVYAATLDCAPHYFDGSAIDLLHLAGSEVVPSSLYEVQSIALGLDVGEEANYSAPIQISTARWGDVILPYSPPDPTAQPNATDHAALVSKFRGFATAISKPRAMQVGVGMAGVPDLTGDISFQDIAASVDAYRGVPFPYTGPVPCP